MPVILEPAAEEVWLNPDVTDPQDLTPHSDTFWRYDATHEQPSYGMAVGVFTRLPLSPVCSW